MAFSDPLDALEAVIRSRRGADPASSYTAALFAKGRPKIAQKLGEEAVEAAIAAVQGDRAALKGEAADVLYHLLVMLVDGGLTLDDVRVELAKREGVSGLVEKAARPKSAEQQVTPTPPPASSLPVSPPLVSPPPLVADDATSPLPISGAVGRGHVGDLANDDAGADRHPLPLPQSGGAK